MLPCRWGELPFTFAWGDWSSGVHPSKGVCKRVPVISTLTDIICWVVGLG
jgi:hypothetical protein